MKVVLIGDKCVGKTSILKSFVSNKFNSGLSSTIGFNYVSKNVEIKENKCFIKLNILDTAGEEKFKSITKQYFKDANSIILVYDITNMDSFKSIDYWFSIIQETKSPSCLLFLVGNKSDMLEKEAVHIDLGKTKALEMDSNFILTSAKENIGIQELFFLNANSYYEYITRLPLIESIDDWHRIVFYNSEYN